MQSWIYIKCLIFASIYSSLLQNSFFSLNLKPQSKTISLITLPTQAKMTKPISSMSLLIPSSAKHKDKWHMLACGFIRNIQNELDYMHIIPIILIELIEASSCYLMIVLDIITKSLNVDVYDLSVDSITDEYYFDDLDDEQTFDMIDIKNANIMNQIVINTKKLGSNCICHTFMKECVKSYVMTHRIEPKTVKWAATVEIFFCAKMCILCTSTYISTKYRYKCT